MYEKMNLLGAMVAIAFFVSAILVFIFRLVGRPQYGHLMGYFEFILVFPLTFLLLTAPQLHRPVLYYIQIGCMLAWLIVAALLDYILKIDFRHVTWMVISFVILFFAGAGKAASVVLVRDNPLDDIRNAQEIQGVFLRGEYFSRQHLDKLLAEARDLARHPNP